MLCYPCKRSSGLGGVIVPVIYLLIYLRTYNTPVRTNKTKLCAVAAAARSITFQIMGEVVCSTYVQYLRERIKRSLVQLQLLRVRSHSKLWGKYLARMGPIYGHYMGLLSRVP